MLKEGNEIDLTFLLAALRRYWVLIGALIGGAVVVTLGVLSLQPKVYKGTSAFRIGQIAPIKLDEEGVRHLEDPHELVVRLMAAYGPQRREATFLKSADLQGRRNAENIVALKAWGESPQSVEKLLDEIHSGLLETHSEAFNEFQSARNLFKSELARQKTQIKNRLNWLEEGIDRISKGNPVLASSMAVEAANLLSELPALEERLMLFSKTSTAIYTFPSSVIAPASGSEVPVRPRLGLFLVLAIIAASTVGVTAAVILHAFRA